MVPFLLAAGAMQYPVRKFLAALTLGRAVRYTILAYLSARYGQDIITFVARHERSVMWGAIAVLVAAGMAVAILLLLRKPKREKRSAS